MNLSFASRIFKSVASFLRPQVRERAATLEPASTQAFDKSRAFHAGSNEERTEGIRHRERTHWRLRTFKLLLLSALLSLGGGTAFAQSVVTFDQASAIPNGLKVCDSTDTYCIDIVADLTNAGAELPTATAVGPGNFGDRHDGPNSHTKLDYSVSSTNSTGGTASPFRFDALSLVGINSLTAGIDSNSIRDSYTFIEGGSWSVDNPATGNIHAATVSINTSVTGGVGSFILQDPEGSNILSRIGDFDTATTLGAGNDSEVLLNMAGAEDGHDVTYTFASPQRTTASLIVFNSGGRRMGWDFDTGLVVNIFVPELTSTKSFGTPVSNGDGTFSVRCRSWSRTPAKRWSAPSKSAMWQGVLQTLVLRFNRSRWHRLFQLPMTAMHQPLLRPR